MIISREELKNLLDDIIEQVRNETLEEAALKIEYWYREEVIKDDDAAILLREMKTPLLKRDE